MALTQFLQLRCGASHAWSWVVDFDRGHRRGLRWRRWQCFQMRRQFTMSMIVPVARNIGT